MPTVSRRATPNSAAEPPPGPLPTLEDGFPNPQVHDVWDYMQALNPAQWNDHIGYLYRSAGGEYLHKFAAAITLDWVKETYGGGGYKLVLKRGSRMVKSEHFSIEGEPKKIAAAPAPAEHMEILRDLVDYLKQMRDEAAQQGKTLDLRASLNQALELQGEGLRAAVKAIAENTLNPRSSPLEALVVPLLSKMLERSLDPPAPAPTQDLTAQADRLFSVWDRIQEKLGVTETVRSDPWAAALAQLVPHLPNLADRVVLAMQHYRDAQLARVGAGQPAITAAPAPQSPPAPVSQDRRNLVVEMFHEEHTGDELALVLDKVAPEFAVSLAAVLRSDPASLATDPVLAPIAGQPRLPKFVQEFLDYFAEPETAVQSPQ